MDAHYPIINNNNNNNWDCYTISLFYESYLSSTRTEEKAGDVCPFSADSKVATMKNVVCADSSDFHAGVWCRCCWTVCQEELHSLAALLTQ